MNADQKIVMVGAASGIVGMIVLVTVLTFHVLGADVANTMGDRLAYALGANVFALLPLFFMLVTIGNERFMSEAIDPLRHKENKTMEINARVANNTLEQNFVFFIASMTLSTVVPMMYIQVVWACAITFVIGRVIFWYGYHQNPLYRAPGLSSVAYMNLFMIAYVLYQLL